MQQGGALPPQMSDSNDAKQRFRRRFREGGGSQHVPARDERTQVFLKTKMCKFFILDVCTKGAACNFAHQRDQLQVLPNLNCTKLCKTLISKGACNNPDCRYAHNKEEMRMVPGFNVSTAATDQQQGMQGQGAGGNGSGGNGRDSRAGARHPQSAPPEKAQPQLLALSAMTESTASSASTAPSTQLNNWMAQQAGAGPNPQFGQGGASAPVIMPSTVNLQQQIAAGGGLDAVSQTALLQIGQAAQAHAAEALRLQAMAAAIQSQAIKGGKNEQTGVTSGGKYGSQAPSDAAAGIPGPKSGDVAGSGTGPQVGAEVMRSPAGGAPPAPGAATAAVAESAKQKKRRGSRGGGGARLAAAAVAQSDARAPVVPPSISEDDSLGGGDAGSAAAQTKMALILQQQQLQQQQQLLQQKNHQLQQQLQHQQAIMQPGAVGNDSEGANLVVKNTFLTLQEDKGAPLRPVKTCSGHLSGWMQENESDGAAGISPVAAGTSERRDSGSRRLHDPVQINPLTLRSVSSQSLRSLDPTPEEDEEQDDMQKQQLGPVPELCGLFMRQPQAEAAAGPPPNTQSMQTAAAGAAVGQSQQPGDADGAGGRGAPATMVYQQMAGHGPWHQGSAGAYDRLHVKNTFLDFPVNDQPVSGLRVVHTAAGRLDMMGGFPSEE